MARKQQPEELTREHRWALLLLPIAGLAVLGCIAYWNSTDVPFVFDDMLTIQRNPGVHFDDYFRLSQYVNTRSLLFLTFAINNRLGGQNVLGYHLVNLGLHILNGILIFGIACQIFRKVEVEKTRARLFAFCAAAFFLVHPVQTEAVTYISSRSELLSAFFYLIGLGCFVAFPENKIGFLASLAVLVSLLLGFGGK